MKYQTKLLPDIIVDKYKPYGRIRFTLPKSKTIDMHSFKIFFNGETNLESEDQTDATKVIARRFARRTQSLIQTLTVMKDKREIERIDHFNILYNAKHDITDDVISNFNLSTKSDPTHKIINDTKLSLPTAVSTTSDDQLIYDKGEYVIDKFLGWMSSGERYLFTGDHDYTIEIILTTPDVLYSSVVHSGYALNNYQEPDYELTNVFAVFNVHDMKGHKTFKDYMCYKFYQPVSVSKSNKEGVYQIPVKIKNMKRLYGTFLRDRTEVKDKELVFVGAKDSNGYGTTTLNTASAYSYKHHLDQNVPHTFCNSEYFILDGVDLKDTLWRLDGYEVSPTRRPVDEYNDIRLMFGKHASCYNVNEFQRYNYLSVLDFTEPNNDNFTNTITNQIEWQVHTNQDSTIETYPFIFVEYQKSY